MLQHRLVRVVLIVAALGGAGARADGLALGDPLRPPLRLDLGAAPQTTEPVAAAPAPQFSGRGRYVLPVLLSAIVPGTGEIATGHPWRGAPLVAIDVGTWVGYAHYHNEGNDWRTRYEAFADAHWDYDRWQDSLRVHYSPPAQMDPNLQWYSNDPNDGDDHCTCTFITREQDRQHYYENVGKYRWFWQGWDDWSYNPLENDVIKSDSAHHRRQYDDMRIQSNDSYDHATSFVVFGMATRLVSVIQTIWLVHSDAQHERLALVPERISGHGLAMAVKWSH